MWQVTTASTVASRFEALHDTALTPLVGRERNSTRCYAAGSGRKPAKDG